MWEHKSHAAADRPWNVSGYGEAFYESGVQGGRVQLYQRLFGRAGGDKKKHEGE